LQRVGESSGVTVSISTAEEFFTAISGDFHVPRLSRCHGSVRLDLMRRDGSDSWRLDINKGDITVTRDDGPADAVLRADEAVIDGVVRGEVNPVAATLRGVMTVEGNWDLLLLSQRIFRDPTLLAERGLIDSQTQ
jgi:hypothetical protein